MNSEALNVALDMALEFGPIWLRQTQDRMRERFPDLDNAELDEYDRQCRRIMDRGWSLGEEIWSGKLAAAEAVARLLKDYPQLQERNVSHLLSQGQYYAMKNGVVAAPVVEPSTLLAGIRRLFR